jgi:plastocyanin
MGAFRMFGAGALIAVLGMAGGPALAGEASREIAVAIEGHRFIPVQITVAAGVPFVLLVKNEDRTAEEFESRELHVEKVVPAGKTVRIRIAALKKGTYPFFGDFHPTTAQGRIVAE